MEKHHSLRILHIRTQSISFFGKRESSDLVVTFLLRINSHVCALESETIALDISLTACSVGLFAKVRHTLIDLCSSPISDLVNIDGCPLLKKI